MKRDTLVVENAPIEEASNVQETEQPLVGDERSMLDVQQWAGWNSMHVMQ